MIEEPKQQQAILFKLGVALHAKYPDDAVNLIDKPLQEVADFLNEHEGVGLSKGKSMEYVDSIADQLLGVSNVVKE